MSRGDRLELSPAYDGDPEHRSPLAAFSVIVNGAGTVSVPDMSSVQELLRDATTSTEVTLVDGYAPRVMAAGPTNTLYMAGSEARSGGRGARRAAVHRPRPRRGVAAGTDGTVYVAASAGIVTLAKNATEDDRLPAVAPTSAESRSTARET